MADRSDADAPRPSDSFPPPEWCARQWPTLCEVLDADDPREVVPRVKTLKNQLDKIDAESSGEGLITISEVEEVLQDMNERLEHLRERNAALIDQMEGQSESGVQSAFKQLHRETEQLLDALGVTNVDEARERVQSFNTQLENLYREKELLMEAGFTGPQEALDAMEALRSERDALAQKRDALVEERDALAQERDALVEKRDALKSERDRLQSERDQLQMQRNRLESARDQANDERDRLRDERDELRAERNALREERDALRRERGPAEATEADEAVRDERDRLEAERERLAERLDAAAEARDRVTQQRDRVVQERNQIRAENTRLSNELASLRSSKPDTSIFEAASVIRQTIGVTSPDEAHALVHTVRQMEERVQALVAEAPAEPDPTGTAASDADASGDVLAALQRMEGQLAAFHDAQTARSPADGSPADGSPADGSPADGSPANDPSAEIPDEVARELGVTTAEEARELATMVRRMGERLDALATEQQTLQHGTGLASAADAMAMIRSMESQLDALYADRDVNRDVDGEAASPDDAIPAEIGAVLGVSTVQEAKELESLVHSMTRQLETFTEQQEKLDQAGLTVDSAIEMIDTMEEQLVDLYDKQGAAPDADASDAYASGADASGADASGADASGADAADADAPDAGDETRDDTASDTAFDDPAALLASLSDAASSASDADPDASDGRTDEADEADDADSDADFYDALTESATPDAGPADDAAPSDESAAEDPTPAASPSADERGDAPLDDRVADVLGVSTEEEARELSALVRTMAQRLNRLTDEHQKLLDVGLSVDKALGMIDNMEEQLVDLYERQDETQPDGSQRDPDDAAPSDASPSDEALASHVQSLVDVLGVSTPDEAEELDALVRALTEELSTLVEEQNRILRETGVDTVGSVVEMVRSMEAQLVDLYEERRASEQAEARLEGIREVLGIETPSEAEELAAIARDMELQLNELYSDRQELQAVGLSSVSDAVAMIDSMEEQLMELYQNQEAVDERATVNLDPEQDTFQQLQALYAEREKLERELGVSSADELIEMVEGLATQLDEFYAGRDVDTASFSLSGGDASPEAAAAPAAADTPGDTPGDMPGDGAATVDVSDRAPAGSAAGSATPADASPTLMLRSMRQQLEALYREKDVLLNHGIASANEAMDHIETLQEQVHALQNEVSASQAHFDRLDRELGTHDAAEIVERIHRLRDDTNGESSAEATSADSAAARPDRGDGLYLDAAPALVPDDTLAALDDMAPDAIDALDCGVFRLSDAGDVEYVSASGLDLPGLNADDPASVTGTNFFFELAPSTNNNLVFGRFRDGVRRGAMNARFPYTFVSPGRGPTVLVVHLYRAPTGDANWLLFRTM